MSNYRGHYLENYVIALIILSNKMKSWGEAKAIVCNGELRNNLRVRAFPVYGNRGPIVNITYDPQRWRSYLSKLI